MTEMIFTPALALSHNIIMKVITVPLSYLYHTTMLNLDDKETEYNYADRPDCYPHWVKPEPGKFSTNLEDYKWFTITAASSYADWSSKERWAFLRYKVKRPLKLLDVRCYDDGSPEYMEARNPDDPRYLAGVDGYIGRGYDEPTETMLVRPKEVLDPNFTLLPYVPVSFPAISGGTQVRLLHLEHKFLGIVPPREELFITPEALDNIKRFFKDSMVDRPLTDQERQLLHENEEREVAGYSIQIPVTQELLDIIFNEMTMK